MSIIWKPRAAAVSASMLLLLGALSGCTPALPPIEPVASPSASVPVESPEPSESVEPAPVADGDALAPGQSTDGTGLIEFVNYDDEAAVFAHRVVSIDMASADDVEYFTSEVPSVAGMQIAYVRVESSFVSGANLEYSSFSAEFDPIDADGNRVQSIITIGFDTCKTNSIPRPGNDPATVIENCYVAAWPSGGSAAAGLQWDQSDTGYGSYDGEPARLFLKQ